MERIFQPVDEKGLQIPLALVRKYGLEKGSDAVLELGEDGIRISAARPDRAAIERRALRYLLTTVGDGGSVRVESLPGETGWQVAVFGYGMEESAGRLVYDLSGNLLPGGSTPASEIRRVITS
jgi:hypothetical protein